MGAEIEVLSSVYTEYVCRCKVKKFDDLGKISSRLFFYWIYSGSN